MDTGRVGNSQSNLPAQVGGAQGQSGEQAFHDLAKSDGYDNAALQEAISDRTRLTRTKKTGKAKKNTSLFVISNEDDELLEEPVYRTVMVDGILFTLRLLAVA